MKNIIILILISSISFTNVFAEACPGAGQVFKNGKCQCADGYKMSMNRCIKTEEQLATENRANQCAQSDNPKECYELMAKKDDSRDRRHGGNDYDTSNLTNFQQAAVHAAMLGISAYVLDFWIARGKGRYSCNPPSMYLLSVGATTLLATEVIAYLGYGKKVRERQEAVERFIKPNAEDSDTSENDIQKDYTLMAYDSIILQEEAYLKASKTRKTGYAVATGIFGAAAATAGVEMILLKGKDKEKKLAEAARNVDPDDPTKHEAAKAAYTKYMNYRKKVICKRYKMDSTAQQRNQAKINEKRSRRSGGGGLSAMLPMLLSPAIGKIMGDTHQKSDEYYVNIENHFNGDFQNLSNDIQSKLINIKNAENFKELEVAMEEREMLASGDISSPSLRDYESQGFLQEVMFEKEQIEAMKTGIMIKESLRDQLDFISLFFADELKSNQAQAKVSSL